MEFLQQWVKIRWLKPTGSKKIIVFCEDITPKGQNLGVILENKAFQKLKLSKSISNKTNPSKRLFFELNENHFQKDSDIFWH